MRGRTLLAVVATALLPACGSDAVGPPGGRLQVVVATTGGDLDLDGYEVVLRDVSHRVAANGALSLVDVVPGEHQVTLRELADNCTLNGSATQTVLVQQGAVASVAFSVACAVAGIEISITTTGPDPDTDGYHFEIAPVPACDPDQPPCVPIGPPLPPIGEVELDAAGSTSISRLRPGYYEVRLSEVATNCTPAESASRVMAVTLGALVQASFAVSCVAVTTSMPPFARQHGVRVSGPGSVLLLENLGDPTTSRAERYVLDESARRARLVESLTPSAPAVVALQGGTTQLLPGGRVLVAYGNGGRVEEYDATGALTWRIEGNPGYIFRAQRIRSLYRPGADGAR